MTRWQSLREAGLALSTHMRQLLIRSSRFARNRIRAGGAEVDLVWSNRRLLSPRIFFVPSFCTFDSPIPSVVSAR